MSQDPRTTSTDRIESPISRRRLIGGAATLTGSLYASAAAAAPRPAPPPPRVTLIVDDAVVAVFDEILVSSAVDVGDALAANLRESLGRSRPPTVTLKRGRNTDDGIWDWHMQAIQGDPAAIKQVVIVVPGSTAEAPVARYHLTDAWPSKLDAGSLSLTAQRTDPVAMETVTIVCERIQRVSV